MEYDARDAIWNKSFETYYDSYYYELLADKLIDRWQFTDDLTKTLVALTASGSAMSGWALWNDEALKYIWAIVAGLGALLSIVHAALGVPHRLKDWEESKNNFANLRVRIETFKHRMEIDPQFSINEFTAEYTGYRKEFGELVPSQKNDFLKTLSLRVKTQQELDNKLFG